jgi:hypothetical protein
MAAADDGDDIDRSGFHYFIQNVRVLALDLADLAKLDDGPTASELRWETLADVVARRDHPPQQLSPQETAALDRLHVALRAVPDAAVETDPAQFAPRAFLAAMEHPAWVNVRLEARLTLDAFAAAIVANDDYFERRRE